MEHRSFAFRDINIWPPSTRGIHELPSFADFPAPMALSAQELSKDQEVSRIRRDEYHSDAIQDGHLKSRHGQSIQTRLKSQNTGSWKKVNVQRRPESKHNWISSSIVKRQHLMTRPLKRKPPTWPTFENLKWTGVVVDLQCSGNPECRHRFFVTDNAESALVYGEGLS